MCMILDANMMGRFLDNQDEDMRPIYQWIYRKNKNGKIVYTDQLKYQSEINYYRKFAKLLQDLKRADRARFIESSKVEKNLKNFENITSDDPHILALAETAKAKLLCSNDKKLHHDFTNLIKKGVVYQNKKHSHLLTPDTCP